MAVWTCPACGRTFGRVRQSHECAPAMTLEEYFSTGPERERPIFDAVMAHVSTLGPVQVQPVSVGIFIKKGRSFVELRPKTKWVAMSFVSDHVIDHPKIARTMKGSGARVYCVVNLYEPADVDDQVRDWLTESYLSLPDP